ncbi:MAG TPA: hypothetical protein VNZ52_14360 [Candidatus Thermoplasmatota archaeon]|nr:hypothetical protein [Candidatus Thermoplasmatota archaeon]
MVTPPATLRLGPIEIPVRVQPALRPHEGVPLKPYCGCGRRPSMRIACKGCGREYGASWTKVPFRAAPLPEDPSTLVLLKAEEVARAKEAAVLRKDLEVEATVPLSFVLGRFVVVEHRHLTLALGGGREAETRFAALVHRLGVDGYAMLARHAVGKQVHRYAITSSPEAGCLVLLRVEDPRPGREKPWSPVALTGPLPEVDEALSHSLGAAVDFTAEPDPLPALVERIRGLGDASRLVKAEEGSDLEETET